MTKKRRVPEGIATATVTEPVAVEKTAIEDLKTCLEEIKSCDGVIGYIIRNATSAAIDLKDPAKLIEYAILSSSSLDAGEELSELFNLGSVENIIVKGKEVKALSLTIGENRISIFFEKNTDIEKALKSLVHFRT